MMEHNRIYRSADIADDPKVTEFVSNFNSIRGTEDAEGKKKVVYEDYLRNFFDLSSLSRGEKLVLSQALPNMNVDLKLETVTEPTTNREIVEDMDVFPSTAIETTDIANILYKPHIPNKTTRFAKLSRLNEKKFGETLKDPSSRSSWDECLAMTLVTRRVFYNYSIVPFNVDDKKSFTKIGHDYYAILKESKDQNSPASVQYGGVEIPIAALGVASAKQTPEEYRAAYDIWYDSKSWPADFDKEIFYTHIQGLRSVLLQKKGTLSEAVLVSRSKNSLIEAEETNPNFTSLNAPVLVEDTLPNSEIDAASFEQRLKDMLVHSPVLQKERFFFPKTPDLVETLSKRYKEFLYISRNPSSTSEVVKNLISKRAQRYFQKADISNLTEDEILVIAARSLYVEWLIPYDEVVNVFADINPRIESWQRRQLELGKFRRHIESSWKSLGLIGIETMTNGGKDYAFAGRCEGLDQILLTTENAESLEEKKKTILHEYIHNLQRSLTEDGNMTKEMFNSKDTNVLTYLEVFTEWLVFHEYGEPTKGKNQYSDGVRKLKLALAQTGDPRAEQLTIDAAITASYSEIDAFLKQSLGKGLADILDGNSDYDYYKDKASKNLASPITTI